MLLEYTPKKQDNQNHMYSFKIKAFMCNKVFSGLTVVLFLKAKAQMRENKVIRMWKFEYKYFKNYKNFIEKTIN